MNELEGLAHERRADADGRSTPPPRSTSSADPTRSAGTTRHRRPNRSRRARRKHRRSCRVGYTTAPPIDIDVAPAYVDRGSKTVDALDALGHDVFEVSLSVPDADAFIESFGLIWNTGSAGVPIDDWDCSNRSTSPSTRPDKRRLDRQYVESVRAPNSWLAR